MVRDKPFAKKLMPANSTFLIWVYENATKFQKLYIMTDVKVEAADWFRIAAKILPYRRSRACPNCLIEGNLQNSLYIKR